MSENQIFELTSREFETMVREYQLKFVSHDKKWGGCFIYCNEYNTRKVLGISVKVTQWIAIDDTQGNFTMRVFKKRRDAVNWLIKNANGKTCRY